MAVKVTEAESSWGCGKALIIEAENEEELEYVRWHLKHGIGKLKESGLAPIRKV